MSDNGCDGCKLLYVGTSCPYKNDECPCKNCIIKMMCKRSCIPFLIHLRLTKEETYSEQ